MRTFIRAFLAAGLIAVFNAAIGCGGNGSISGNCTLTTVITVSPTSATVNHAAAPPANQVQFIGVGRFTAPPGCAAPALAFLVYGTWSDPDPTDITISSANDSTNGTAECKSATNGAVTLTGTFDQLVPAPVTRTVQLTCN